ncbi:MAG: prolyl oligopeptidase family serine peptidase [Acidimicrobiia bacterium]
MSDTALTAGAPLEPPRSPVGRFTTTVVDPARAGRELPVGVWYPARIGSAEPHSFYEVIPGIGFTATAHDDAAVLVGRHPLVLWSHGRFATGANYALLGEALAARGFVVVAPEHRGDALGDWLTGQSVDDATNETNRIGDAHFVLDSVLSGAGSLGRLTPFVDPDRVAAAGHSYGGFTALSVGSGATKHPAVRAVAGHQTLTRTMVKSVFADLLVPTLLVVSALDATTPPATDADRAWAKLGASDAWRVDVARAGHQACSDVGLYLELASQVPNIPDLVKGFVASMGPDVTGVAGEPWRATVHQQLQTLAGFLTGALGVDVAAAERELAAVGAATGVEIAVRGGFTT